MMGHLAEATGPVPGFGFRWVTVAPGRLALWHRLRLRTIPYLPKSGCDRVVTLLSGSEGAREIGQAVERAGLAWSWIPLPGGRPPEGRRDREARAGLAEIDLALDRGESALIHCSAGIHRTGMMSYALLRERGLNREDALQCIEQLRPHTRAGLSEAHLAWGDRKTEEP